MAKPSAPTATAFDHASTLVLALELSGKSWEVGAILPGVTRRPRRSLAARDMTGLLQQIERWKAEAQRAGRTVCRTVLAYEAGRDGFWIARYLLARGIEVQIMHPASIPVERRGRRTKTDRIDLDMLLRSLLAWLRGEPRVCSMVRIPSEAEEDMRRPERERERLVGERIALENRIENLLCLHGIINFKPRLKKAAERLDALRSYAGAPLPPGTKVRTWIGTLRSVIAHRSAPQCLEPDPRYPSWPAVIRSRSTGRIHDCSSPNANAARNSWPNGGRPYMTTKARGARKSSYAMRRRAYRGIFVRLRITAKAMAAASTPATTKGGNGVIAIPPIANAEAITISTTEDATSQRLG